MMSQLTGLDLAGRIYISRGLLTLSLLESCHEIAARGVFGFGLTGRLIT
jgi:hypothetical protein